MEIKKNTDLMGGNIHQVSNIEVKELDIFARIPEGQLLHYYEPEPGLFIAESPKVVERALEAGYEPVAILAEESNLRGETAAVVKSCGDVPIYVASEELLSGIKGYQLTRGFLCAMRRRELPTLEMVLEGARRVVVLEDVVNPTNVGAIFRSAAALNMDAVILTAGCSDPLYRRAIRVSMGTVFQIPWTFLEKGEGAEILKAHGYKTVAFALRNDSISIDAPELSAEEKLAIVMGTEGEGLREDTIADSDYTVKIPMSHGVDSLNVAAASAIAFWELGK